MKLRLESVSLERFRAFRKLEVHGLGRVNLITGKNNTGKSSFLEALRLLASNAAWEVIRAILSDREENPNERISRDEGEDWFLALSSLFYGHPELSKTQDAIVISANDSEELTLNLEKVVEETDDDGNMRFTPVPEDMPRDEVGDLVLIVGVDGKHRIRKVQDIPYVGRKVRAILREEPRIPCEFVGPYSGRGTSPLAHLWDRVTLTDDYKYVVEALRIIDSNISAVNMVGEGSDFRTAFVRADNISRRVPLRSFGDGLNRLFGIILSLVCAKNGILLIDEFENGLHHTIQYKTWSTVFELARMLNIQVFATSHSWDAIEAFQKAAEDTPEVGALIRLSRKGEDIVPTVFTEDDLAVVTRDRIEVR